MENRKEFMSDLYQEIILEHAKYPHHFGELQHPTHTLKGVNARCGDMLELQLIVVNGKIQEIAWKGNGCAISTASSSILSDLIKGKTVVQAKKISIKDLLIEMGLKTIMPVREKCLTLALKTLQNLLNTANL